MKSTLLLIPLLTTLTHAQTTINIDTCGGSVFNNYCCVNGQFSGPAISSFLSSFSSRESSRAESFSLRESSFSSSLSSRLASITSRTEDLAAAVTQSPWSPDNENENFDKRREGAREAPVTARAILEKRVITTEVAPGLTCIGDSVRTLSAGVSESGRTFTRTSSPDPTPLNGIGPGGSAETSISSARGAVVTNVPCAGVVLVGGAAVAFAYGVM